MTIHVRETKGRIDRYTILSQKNLDLLTEYWYKCGRPKDILFPSFWSGGYLDIASVNQFFKKSAKLAGINRHVSSHACRHSFASHLFESGTDSVLIIYYFYGARIRLWVLTIHKLYYFSVLASTYK